MKQACTQRFNNLILNLISHAFPPLIQADQADIWHVQLEKPGTLFFVGGILVAVLWFYQAL